ncbi:eukaryotic translation initiation factor 4E type 3-like [Ischnura elegans]|uniref:eukaryotic translation initiation factor 4E type 3-like n=1 Tax=Ischnura elegans TaxID=197161 RepID=UPI001ED8895C|nr:eukaryotic translation initiation factor 4E type 3-like [Ischnura elegans]
MATLSTDVSIDLSKSPVISHATIRTYEEEEKEKVPLQTSWTFWLDKAVRGTTAAEFEANLKRIYEVSTVQGFWAVLRHIPPANELKPRYSYHLMRGSRRPLWEEKDNERGGTWRLKCSKRDTVNVWKELLLAAIGEQLSDLVHPDDEICGVTVSIRDRPSSRGGGMGEDLVQVWNTRADLADKANMLEAIQRLLPDVHFSTKFYKAHVSHDAFEGEKETSSGAFHRRM